MTLEVLLILFGVVIGIQCFVMYVMYVRIRQLLSEDFGGLGEEEVDALIRSIDLFREQNLK
ncbi:MAG: hypothetical protein NT074_06005 [Methanomicrobiales archaeon]|nr:hypothetical protein [Methanomicrobiales archaeon]